MAKEGGEGTFPGQHLWADYTSVLTEQLALQLTEKYAELCFLVSLGFHQPN